MPRNLLSSPWVYGFYNAECFGTFEEVIVKDQVSVMNSCRIMNSKTVVINFPMKENIKTCTNLSIPCDI